MKSISIFTIVGIIAFAGNILAQESALPGKLSDTTVVALFGSMTNEVNEAYALEDIKIREGAFTAKGAIEALVSFSDGNQGRAVGEAELWLLKWKDGKWTVVRKIEDCGGVLFETVDIEKDGRLEVWVSVGGGSQGYFGWTGLLLSIGEKEDTRLYSNESWDNTGAEKAGEALCEHKVGFWDIDEDGTLEILDREVVKTFKLSTGGKMPPGDPSVKYEYTEVSSKETTVILKLVDGKFVKTSFRAQK